MQVRYSQKQWAQWIDEHAKSNVSVKEFCQLHNLQVQSFYNWRAKLATRSSEAQHSQPLFVPLTLRSPSTTGRSNTVEVHMPCGAKLCVPADAIATVLHVLHQLGNKS